MTDHIVQLCKMLGLNDEQSQTAQKHDRRDNPFGFDFSIPLHYCLTALGSRQVQLYCRTCRGKPTLHELSTKDGDFVCLTCGRIRRVEPIEG